jgi:hypothetical protein
MTYICIFRGPTHLIGFAKIGNCIEENYLKLNSGWNYKYNKFQNKHITFKLNLQYKLQMLI